MTRLLPLAVFGLSTAFSATTVLADTEEPPIYLATDGKDGGDCRSEAQACRTIAYALKRVGKNGQILVGDGTFELDTPEDVVYLLSGATEVRGSYRDGMRSRLVGVPPEYAGELAELGFSVIVDSKSLSDDARQRFEKIVQTQQRVSQNTASTACTAGFAGAFPCDKVDLLSHIADRTPGARGADVWGFVDLNTDREYAIMGYSTGTAVYDVTDAEAPHEVGFVDGQTTTWRDIKVHQRWDSAAGRWIAYAYVTADDASDGLVVIDLTELPHRISKLTSTSDFVSAHNVYIAGVDFATGLMTDDAFPLMIVAGSNREDGRFRAYAIEEPDRPDFIDRPVTPVDQAGGDRLYMHDGAAMRITGTRATTQCITPSGIGCDVVFDFNESTVDIWDASSPQNIQRISQTPYPNSGYTHSGWPTEDQQYLFVHDELDERDRGLMTTVRVLDISDLRSPVLAATWTGPTRAIDHNGFVRGNRYYMSNYARGLTILDITDPASPTEIGRFDTYPAGDTVGFPGAWGTYPFLPSGNIVVSDIDSGLYLLRDNTLAVAPGTLSFGSTSTGADETQTAVLDVQRIGGTQGAVSVNWEAIGASGIDDDIVVNSGTLNWPDGDATSRTIDIGLNDDGSPEGLERVILRLFAPTGGATLSAPAMTSLYVADPGDTPQIAFDVTAISMAERGFARAIGVVKRSGSAAGDVSVDYAIADGDATSGSDYSGPQNGTLTWADGDASPKWLEFEIADDGNTESDEYFEIALSNAVGGSIGANAMLRVDIVDGTGVNSAPNAVAGANRTVNGGVTVTLDGGGSNDPDGDALTYAWSQSMGPSVSLSDTSASNPTFTAPSVSSDTLLRFDLTVTDSGGQSDTASVNITVTANSGGGTTGGGSGGGGLSFWFLAALLLVRRLLERMRFDDGLRPVRPR